MTGHFLHYRYAQRPIVPGAYHVWTRDDRCRYLGTVCRIYGYPGGPWWIASGLGSARFATRESAARALDEERQLALDRLHESMRANGLGQAVPQ